VLECEYCEKHFCRSCVKLSSTEYKLLTKRSDLNRASLLHNLKSNALVQTQQGFLANSILIYDIFICCPCNISYVQGFLA
jgi:hypothetical protein